MERIIRNSLDVVEGKKTIIKDEGLVKQEFKKECDVNNIVKLYLRNGHNLMAQTVKLDPTIAVDLSKIPDYAEALNQVLLAQDAFLELDPQLRRRFNDDPSELIEFIKDPANKAEGQKLGIFEPDPEPPQDSPKA